MINPDSFQTRLDSNLETFTNGIRWNAVIQEDPTCPRVYRDARNFFAATYLTSELKFFFRDVLQGLTGEGGDRILPVPSSFDVGKTHALLSLYHLAKHRQELHTIPQLHTLPNPGEVRVAAFGGREMSDCAEIEIENGPRILTPWGYLAWQMGGYETYALVEKADRQRIAPEKDTLIKVFGDRANLILIDDFLLYVETAINLQVGDSTFPRQVFIFMQHLMEVVRDLPKTVFVYTLESSIPQTSNHEGLLTALDRLVNRIDPKSQPISQDEVIRSIQPRLVSDRDRPELVRQIAQKPATISHKFRKIYAFNGRRKTSPSALKTSSGDRKINVQFLDSSLHHQSSQKNPLAIAFCEPAIVLYSFGEKSQAQKTAPPGHRIWDRDRFNSPLNLNHPIFRDERRHKGKHPLAIAGLTAPSSTYKFRPNPSKKAIDSSPNLRSKIHSDFCWFDDDRLLNVPLLRNNSPLDIEAIAVPFSLTPEPNLQQHIVLLKIPILSTSAPLKRLWRSGSATSEIGSVTQKKQVSYFFPVLNSATFPGENSIPQPILKLLEKAIYYCAFRVDCALPSLSVPSSARSHHLSARQPPSSPSPLFESQNLQPPKPAVSRSLSSRNRDRHNPPSSGGKIRPFGSVVLNGSSFLNLLH